MCLPSSMSEAAKSVIVKFAEEEAYNPPSRFLLDLIVSKVVEAPWFASGKKPRNWLANTTSTKVLVAFKNRMVCQFSKEVRRAPTAPFQEISRALSTEVEAATLWSTMESNNFKVAGGTPGTSGCGVEV